jgi:hypothetical protein
VNVNTGDIVAVAVGSFDELDALGVPKTGLRAPKAAP